ncbi:MAG: hypothetical protein M3Q44_01765 [bacterium]|nr:hypothetical protein [bacterium]
MTLGQGAVNRPDYHEKLQSLSQDEIEGLAIINRITAYSGDSLISMRVSEDVLQQLRDKGLVEQTTVLQDFQRVLVTLRPSRDISRLNPVQLTPAELNYHNVHDALSQWSRNPEIWQEMSNKPAYRIESGFKVYLDSIT